MTTPTLTSAQIFHLRDARSKRERLDVDLRLARFVSLADFDGFAEDDDYRGDLDSIAELIAVAKRRLES